jgi:small subunit ribosomal protein S20
VANIKSQIKRIKTNEKARQRNKAVTSSLKTSVRRFREAAQAGDVEKAQEYARTASRQLD